MSIEELCSILDNKEVVEHYLGEGIARGDSIAYSSPFRKDSNPSFSVSDKYISDFGDKNFIGKNIVDFVARYKNVSKEQAIDIIKKDFQIDDNITYSKSTSKRKSNQSNSKTKNAIKVSVAEKIDKIVCMFDEFEFSEKPKGYEVGGIKNRINENQFKGYTLDEIKQNIVLGKTTIPSGIKGSAKENFKGQQLYMIDIDNAIEENGKKVNFTTDDERHITIEKIIDYCKQINLLPTFAYYSFSHSEKQHKMRLVYILNEVITDYEIAKGFINYLLEKLSIFYPDSKPTNLASMFFGGKAIAYESDIFYKLDVIKVKEKEVKKKANSSIPNDYQKDIELLENSNYVFAEDGLYEKKEKISNFVPIISKVIIYDNGNGEKSAVYKIKAVLSNGDILDEIEVKIEDFTSMKWLINNTWDMSPIVNAGVSNKDKLREVTQIVSKNMQKEVVYTHTGFIKQNDKYVYLYNNGNIGGDDTIKVNLDDSLVRYEFTNQEYDLKECLQLSYSILDVADKKITLPLVAFTYLAPLVSLLDELGIVPDFLIAVVGVSGSRKSSLSALLNCHYGRFDKDSFICSCKDTINSIEVRSNLLADTLVVLDDYYPSTETNEAKKMKNTLEKVIAIYGDRSARGRLNVDVTLRKSYKAKGLCLVTGESFPDVSESRLARCFIIDLKKDSIDLDKLTILQRNKDKLSYAMKQYIKVLIANIDKIKNNAKDKFEKYRNDITNNLLHGRTAEIICFLQISYELFISFLISYEIISEQDKEKLLKESWDILNFVANEQTLKIQDNKPINMFFNAISQLENTGKVYIVRNWQESYLTDNKNKTLIGFVDETKDDYNNYYYFFPETVLNEVSKFYSQQGIKFPINKTGLQKHLADEGYLKTGSDRTTIRKKIPGPTSREKTEIVWAVKKDKVPYLELQAYGTNPPKCD